MNHQIPGSLGMQAGYPLTLGGAIPSFLGGTGNPLEMPWMKEDSFVLC